MRGSAKTHVSQAVPKLGARAFLRAGFDPEVGLPRREQTEFERRSRAFEGADAVARDVVVRRLIAVRGRSDHPKRAVVGRRDGYGAARAGRVWGEIAGMYLVLLVTPFTLWAWGAAFLLFRLFDIWKPWPIRDLDHRLGGGTGIMLDDLVAALYAALLLGFYRWLMV